MTADNDRHLTWPRIKTDEQLLEGVTNACVLYEHPEPRPCPICTARLERAKVSRDERLAEF